MKIRYLISIALLSVFALGEAQELPMSDTDLTPWIDADKESMRALASQTVSVVLLTVQNKDKDAFELWIDEVLYAALYESQNPMKKAQLNAVRYLEPVQQNKDGSWHYCWIMDPIIPNTDYNIPVFLQQEYGEEQGKKHWEKYLSMVEFKSMVFRQTGK